MIYFKKIRYQNILATGNQFTEIELNRHGSTLVVGENGAGKSTMIEALTFALYGKPFRDINKPQLINTITNKGLLVEVEFTIGSKEYLVRRGAKPTIFEIFQNGTLIKQQVVGDYQEHLEKQILKLNFKAFGQIVVLGRANYTPFMQLKTTDRRAVVENFLDIQIFSLMNSLLKGKVDVNKTDGKELDANIRLVEQKIDMHTRHVEAMRANNEELIQMKMEKIVDHTSLIDEYTSASEEVFQQAEELRTSIADHRKVNNRREKLVQAEAQLEERIRKLGKEVQFYHNHDNCPTCRQGIEHDFRTETIAAREAKTQEVKDMMVQIEAEILKVNARLNEISDVMVKIQELQNRVADNNQQVKLYRQYVSDLEREIETLQRQTQASAKNDSDASEMASDLGKYKADKEALTKQKAMMDAAAHLLKDSGIKTKIIRQYVPVMNKLINKYLASMDFMCDFHLDESFNETIRSRFRDKFTYASFSEGEKARLDLALMFTWRAIAKLRNSASTNLLILDETFDGSLDGAGSDELMRILENVASDSNVFVISHKADTFADKFRNVIRFEKNGNFSRIAA